MSHHSTDTRQASPLDAVLAAGGSHTVLVGNPNVGKSVLFKNLTNRYVTVSNYPGTTVEVVRARASFNGRRIEVIDTPGLNDLAPSSEDARVTLNLLDEHADATIVQVADAKNLRRALMLTLQLAELQRPMVLVLNMMDELAERGGAIDTDRLSELLGIPVIKTIAPRNEGTPDLIDALPRATVPRLDRELLKEAASEAAEMPSQPSAGIGGSLPVIQQPVPGFADSRERLAVVKRIINETYAIAPPEHPSLRVRLGFWAMHPVKGFVLLLGVLMAVFWFVGLFGAGTLVDILEVGGFEQRLSPLAIRAADAVLPFPHAHDIEPVTLSIGLPTSPAHEIGLTEVSRSVIRPTYSIPSGPDLSVGQEILRFIHDLLVGRFGTITMALSYALAIVLPIVTTFFFIFSILEDSGYFPRMALMLNRSFRLMGLNGKAVLPMLLGLGCATMATMTTRILETRKERIITTMLLALAVPCSAQLGVLLAMMATLSPAGTLIWLALVVAIMLAVGYLTARIFGGETSEFVLEIPPMRRPQLSNVLVKTASRLDWYLREVLPIFVIGTAVLFLFDRLQLLGTIARVGEPLVSGWLGLPAEMANAFLVGFLRRDFGAVYILDAVNAPVPLLTPHQILVAMVTITLFMPCFANLLMIAREHGTKVALSMVAFIFPFAFFVGGAINHVGRWLTS